MWHGIAALATGKFVGDIGNTVDDYVSSVPGKALGILEDYVGHGIGSEMHMAPDVPNYRTNHRGPKIRPGLCLAIEPMLVRGSIDTAVLDDDWTVVTTDGKRSCQWEHSVAVHEKGIWCSPHPTGEPRNWRRSASCPSRSLSNGTGSTPAWRQRRTSLPVTQQIPGDAGMRQRRDSSYQERVSASSALELSASRPWCRCLPGWPSAPSWWP